MLHSFRRFDVSKFVRKTNTPNIRTSILRGIFLYYLDRYHLETLSVDKSEVYL